jgi:hypothetical protein
LAKVEPHFLVQEYILFGSLALFQGRNERCLDWQVFVGSSRAVSCEEEEFGLPDKVLVVEEAPCWKTRNRALFGSLVRTAKASISFQSGERPGLSFCHAQTILAALGLSLLAGLFAPAGVGEPLGLGCRVSSSWRRFKLKAGPPTVSGGEG